MRRLLVLWLVACSGSDEEPQKSFAPRATTPRFGVSAPAAEPLRFGAPVDERRPNAPLRLWHGRPGTPIAAVFATEDGSAAVSVDTHGHARLWPALDGSREPWVVPLGIPKHVALLRAGDAIAVASLDEGGGLELVSITDGGELTTREKLGIDPGFDHVHASGSSFLALRRDQTLVEIDTSGSIIGTLVPPPGEHVLALLHRNGRTLALVRRKDGVRGRWLAADALAWAEDTPKLAIDLRAVALSPDHRRLVTFRPDPEAGTFGNLFEDAFGETFLVDLKTGKSRLFGAAARGEGPAGVPIGFSSDGLVVTALGDFELSRIEWWTTTGHERAQIGGSDYALELVNIGALAFGDTAIVTAAGHELAVVRRHDARGPSNVTFLGYRAKRANRLRATTAGVLAHAAGGTFVVDEHAQVKQRFAAVDAVPVDDSLAIVQLGAVKKPDEPIGRPVPVAIDQNWLEKEWRRGQPLVPARFGLYDLEAKKLVQHWPIPRAFHYDGSTRLLVLVRGTRVEIAQLDEATRRFGTLRALAAPATHVAPLDPALADGNVVALARQRGGSVEIRLVRDIATPLPEPTELTGTLEAIDRTGRVYLRHDAATVVTNDGRELTGLAGWTVRPHPAGTHVAAFAKNRLALFDANGAQLWAVGMHLVRDVAWTHDGQLFALAGDIARIDLADGSVVAAQCGWAFGRRNRAPDQEDVPSELGTICDR